MHIDIHVDVAMTLVEILQVTLIIEKCKKHESPLALNYFGAITAFPVVFLLFILVINIFLFRLILLF